MKHLLRRFALLATALLVALVLLEVAVRLFDPLGVSHFRDMQRYLVEFCEHPGPPRILRQPPHSELVLHGFSIRTNDLGLRGPDLPATKAAGERRVLFLGDSVVLGWGAAEADLFVTRAEAELNAKAPAGRSYRCVNAGHNQYDTVQEAALLEELGPRIAPDAVILVYVVNDVEPTVRVWNAFVAQQNQAATAPPGFLARTWGWLRSDAFRGLNGIAILLAQNRGSAAAPPAAEPALDAEGWQRSRAALLRIRDWCKQRKTPFILLDHTHPGTAHHAPEIPPLIPFLAAAKIRRFPFHFTLEERRQPIRHSVSDAHANRLGHDLLLAKLRPALTALGLETR